MDVAPPVDDGFLRLYVGLGKAVRWLGRCRFRGQYRASRLVLTEVLGGDSRAVSAVLDEIAMNRALKSIDFFLFRFLSPAMVERLVVREEVEAAEGVIGTEVLSGERAGIFCGLHFGNQNWLPAMFKHFLGFSIDCLREGRSKWLNDLACPGEVHLAGRTGDTMRLIRRMRRGISLGMVADVFSDAALKDWCEVSFFGRRIRWPSGPARLRELTDARFFCFFCHRLPSGRMGLFLRRVEVEGGGDSSPADFTQRYVAVFEQEIGKRPGQWLRWRYLIDRYGLSL